MTGWRADYWLARLGRWVEKKRGRPVAGDLDFWSVGAHIRVPGATHPKEIVFVEHSADGVRIGLRHKSEVIDGYVPLDCPITYEEPALFVVQPITKESA